jgi:hypothetical protein
MIDRFFAIVKKINQGRRRRNEKGVIDCDVGSFSRMHSSRDS